MQRNIVTFHFFLTFLFSFNLFANNIDEIWNRRNELTKKNARQLISNFPALFEKDSQSYDLWWKYSRNLNFYGMYFASKEEKKNIFFKAKEAAYNATIISPDGIEGHIWLGVSLGNWGKANGVIKSLKVVPDIEKNMKEVLTKNPEVNEAIAYRVLGRLYFMVPPRPLSIGNKQKALEYLKKALSIAPENKKNYLYIADVLYSQKKYREALDYVNKALSMPIRREHKIEEKHDIADLKILKTKILKKLARAK